MCQFNQSILFVLFLPVLIFAIPKPIEIDTTSSSTHIGHFKTLSHEVSGELHATDDESVLEIKNFNYDGSGPAAYFYVGRHGTEIQNANSIGIKIPYPENSNAKLPGFKSETIKIRLPGGIRFQDIGWFSVWCDRFAVDFGHVKIDKSETTIIGPPETLENDDEMIFEIVSENISVVSQPVRFPEEDVKQPQIEYEYDYDYEEIGSVRLVEQKFPEVFWNGIWTPICGYWFWNNDFGADLFCQKLDSKYISGTVTMRPDIKLIRDGIRIGECKQEDSWLSCTGGCNDLKTGSGRCAKCDAGQPAAVEIKCHEFVKGGVYVSSNQTTFPDLVSEKIGSSSMLQKTKLSDDENGSVRLVGQKFPEVFWDGIWTPICGYWFWNNDNGADLFCKKLDPKYMSGMVTRRQDIRLIRDGLRLGECKPGDNSLFSCTGGCNDLRTGSGSCARCDIGEPAAVEIKCHQFMKGGRGKFPEVFWNGNWRPISQPKIGVAAPKVQQPKPQQFSEKNNGDVRLVEGKFPEVLWDGFWMPICGHWFWNNDYGARAFCQKLDSKYKSGTVTVRKDIKLIRDGIRIGECKSQDKWLSCTGGCNDLGTGYGWGCGNCEVGQAAAVEIKCLESRLLINSINNN